MKAIVLSMTLSLVAACGADNNKGSRTGGQPATALKVTVDAAGGTATSADGLLEIEILPGSLSGAAELSIGNGGEAPNPADALSKLYDLTLNPSTSATADFEARLRFTLDGAAVETAGAQNLVVGWRRQSGPFDGLLRGAWSPADQIFLVTTPHFTEFGVVRVEGLDDCLCNTGAECQSGCESCDPDCQSTGGGGGGGGSGTSIPTGPCTVDGDCAGGGMCLSGSCLVFCSGGACPEATSCVSSFYCAPACTIVEDCWSGCCQDGFCAPTLFCDLGGGLPGGGSFP